jgi:hypothetical protein
MIEETLKKIESRIRDAEAISGKGKSELLTLRLDAEVGDHKPLKDTRGARRKHHRLHRPLDA